MSMTINAVSQGDYSPYRSKPTIQKSSQSLATGTMLSQASSGASEMAIYEKMTAQMQGLQAGVYNTANMSSLVSTAEGGLSAINDNLQRIRELSLQAANGILSREDRSIIQNEIGQLMSGINAVSSYTEFNGMKLLNGTFVNRNTASTANGTGKQISIGNMSLGGLSMTGFNVTGGFDVGQVDRAINTVTGARASLGAISNSFGHTINANEGAVMNLAAARSRFADTNIARASTQHSRNRLINQYQVLMQHNDMARAKNAMNINR